MFSLNAPPGFGLSFSISETTSRSSSLLIFNFCLIFSKCFLENKSKKSSIILIAKSIVFPLFFLLSCKSKHCLRSLAPIPGGSRRYILSRIFWISISLASTPSVNTKSSEISKISLLKYPKGSKLPIINSAICWSFLFKENECNWALRNWLNEVPDAKGIS